MLQDLNLTSNSHANDEVDQMSSNHDSASQERSTYSTNSRVPLPYHKSM